MSHHKTTPIEPDATAVENDSRSENDRMVTPPGPFTRSELSRWASLIADGTIAVPKGLSPDQQEQLVEEVRCRRRARLVQYIAHAIALDIANTRGPKHGG